MMVKPCAECISSGHSCCIGMQVFITVGDIRRIGKFLGHNGFVTFEQNEPQYQESDGDSTWLPQILRADGCRRVLKRNKKNKCIFLEGIGCILPIAVRPLLCRIFPYKFLEASVIGISSECFISRLDDWQSELDRLGMPLARAQEWHHLLYSEIKLERIMSLCRK